MGNVHSHRRAARRYYYRNKDKEEFRLKRNAAKKAWKERNRSKVAEAARRRYAAKTPEEKEELRKKAREYYYGNRERALVGVKAYNQRLRQEMLTAYGGKCICCGEVKEGFLTLDHFGEDRGKIIPGHPFGHRYRGPYEYKRLRDAGWPTEGLRILCMNCNWATRGGRQCPHTVSL